MISDYKAEVSIERRRGWEGGVAYEIYCTTGVTSTEPVMISINRPDHYLDKY